MIFASAAEGVTGRLDEAVRWAHRITEGGFRRATCYAPNGNVSVLAQASLWAAILAGPCSKQYLCRLVLAVRAQGGRQVEETTATLEESFRALDAGTEALNRVARTVAAETRRATKAAASGDLKTLNTATDKLRAARRDLDRTGEALVAAVQACEKTVGDRLGSGYLEEVTRQVTSAGGEALPHEGQLLCHPSIVRVNTETRRVTIDGRAWKSIRPSALTAELLKRQKRPVASASKSEAFLEALHKVYRRIVRRRDPAWQRGALLRRWYRWPKSTS